MKKKMEKKTLLVKIAQKSESTLRIKYSKAKTNFQRIATGANDSNEPILKQK
jgi:hypothetical protein